MKIGILGTGMVGETIATKLVELGHEVMMGSRTADNEKAVAWAEKAGASHGTFEDAAEFGNIIFLCVKGEAALDVMKMAGGVDGKTIVDVTNPLDFSKGMPPSLLVCNTDSLGERLQSAFPQANIVKTLNIVNCELMVSPQKCGGEPTMFLCGNSAEAKKEALSILRQFGWKDVIDLGDITNARGTEMMLPIWLRTWAATGSPHFAFKVIRK